jgi:hypothetical protein
MLTQEHGIKEEHYDFLSGTKIFQVLTVVFWDVTPSGLAGGY